LILIISRCLSNVQKKARDIMAEEIVICPECGAEIMLSDMEEHQDMEKLEKKMMKEFQYYFITVGKEIRS
jgi:hypothetical protein